MERQEISLDARRAEAGRRTWVGRLCDFSQICEFLKARAINNGYKK